MSKEVLNLEAFVPAERIVKLGGREFDVSFIPASVAFKVYENMESFSRMNNQGVKMEDYRVILDILSMIFKRSHKDITSDWIDENVHIKDMIKLINFVMEPMHRLEEQEKKTEMDDQPESQ